MVRLGFFGLSGEGEGEGSIWMNNLYTTPTPLWGYLSGFVQVFWSVFRFTSSHFRFIWVRLTLFIIFFLIFQNFIVFGPLSQVL